MIRELSRLQFLLSPLIVTVVYSLLITIWSFDSLKYFLQIANFYAHNIIIQWILLGIAMAIYALLKQAFNPKRLPISQYLIQCLENARRPSTQIIAIAPPLIFILLMPAYCLFKQTVIPQSGFWAGPIIMRAEHMMLFGHHAWQLTHGLLPPEATYWLDKFYSGWIALMAGSMLICSYLSGDPAHRCRFMLSFVAAWIISGTTLAYIFPAAGPVYLADFHGGPDIFAPLKAKLAADDMLAKAQHGEGIYALQAQSYLLHGIKSNALFAVGGISAMPSMHNAMSSLMACAGFGVNRVLGWIMLLFAVIIFVGSVHLGWHYALDGIVGAAVSCAIWYSSGRLLRRYERRIADDANSTHPGRRAADKHLALLGA
jgi:membrane-associated phospholipid phosphatase